MSYFGSRIARRQLALEVRSVQSMSSDFSRVSGLRTGVDTTRRVSSLATPERVCGHPAAVSMH